MDLRTLCGTKIPYLWYLYSTISSLTPVVESGRSLTGASGFLIGAEIDCSHEVFWEALSIFLMIDNNSHYESIKNSRAAMLAKYNK